MCKNPPSSFPTQEGRRTNAKTRFSDRFRHLNTNLYAAFTIRLLEIAYPKECPHCSVPLTVPVRNRENAVRCPQCHGPIALTDDTSLSDIACPSCGSSFSLLGEETVTYQTADAETIGHFELIDVSMSTLWE